MKIYIILIKNGEFILYWSINKWKNKVGYLGNFLQAGGALGTKLFRPQFQQTQK